MHDLDPADRPRTLSVAIDPLRGAPPVGIWVIWHGPKAAAVLRLAQEQGRLATAEERAGVQLPDGIPAPIESFAPAWILEQGGGRWFLRRDGNGQYVSCYIAHSGPVRGASLPSVNPLLRDQLHPEGREQHAKGLYLVVLQMLTRGPPCLLLAGFVDTEVAPQSLRVADIEAVVVVLVSLLRGQPPAIGPPRARPFRAWSATAAKRWVSRASISR